MKKRVQFKKEVQLRKFTAANTSGEEDEEIPLVRNSLNCTSNDAAKANHDESSEGSENGSTNEDEEGEGEGSDDDEAIDKQDSSQPTIRLRAPRSFRFFPLRNTYEFDRLSAELRRPPSKKSKIMPSTLVDVDRLLAEIRSTSANTTDKVYEDAEFDGGKSITFTVGGKKKASKMTRAEQQAAHIEERKRLRRTAGPVMRHLKPLPLKVQSRLFFRNSKSKKR